MLRRYMNWVQRGHICTLLQEAVERAQSELNITFLNLDWVDDTAFEISDESFVECCRFIHRARTSGNSVLVHCAQVNKSPFLSLFSKCFVSVVNRESQDQRLL